MVSLTEKSLFVLFVCFCLKSSQKKTFLQCVPQRQEYSGEGYTSRDNSTMDAVRTLDAKK